MLNSSARLTSARITSASRMRQQRQQSRATPSASRRQKPSTLPAGSEAYTRSLSGWAVQGKAPLATRPRNRRNATMRAARANLRSGGDGQPGDKMLNKKTMDSRQLNKKPMTIFAVAVCGICCTMTIRSAPGIGSGTRQRQAISRATSFLAVCGDRRIPCMRGVLHLQRSLLPPDPVSQLREPT